MIRGVLFGLIGALIGAVGWVLLIVYAGMEMGIVAWAIGGLVGFLVGKGTPEEDEGTASGIAACVIAALAIVAGKFVAVSYLIDSELKGVMAEKFLSDDELAIDLAWDEVVELQIAENAEDLQWPGGAEPDEVESFEDFPSSIQSVVEEKLEAMSKEEIAMAKEESLAVRQAVVGSITTSAKGAFFKESFSFFDVLWFGLAMFTAYKLGSGVADDD